MAPALGDGAVTGVPLGRRRQHQVARTQVGHGNGRGLAGQQHHNRRKQERRPRTEPRATRLFISGPPRSRAGMPAAKKRRPGLARTAAVRIICIQFSGPVPTKPGSQW